MLCGVEVKSEQMSLKSFAEDGEWFCRPDFGWEFIPLLRCQNREELQLHWAGFVCSQWWGYQSASWCRQAKCSRWGVWSDQCLEVDGCSSIDGLEGQHHCLESDAGITSSHLLWGKIRSCGSCGGKICMIEPEQWFWGHRIVHHQGLCPGSSPTMKAILWYPRQWLTGQSFPRMKRKTKVEFEVMRSCPSLDICQTFWDAHCNVGVGGGWGKWEEQIGVVSITVVGESIRCYCRTWWYSV